MYSLSFPSLVISLRSWRLDWLERMHGFQFFKQSFVSPLAIAQFSIKHILTSFSFIACITCISNAWLQLKWLVGWHFQQIGFLTIKGLWQLDLATMVSPNVFIGETTPPIFHWSTWSLLRLNQASKEESLGRPMVILGFKRLPKKSKPSVPVLHFSFLGCHQVLFVFREVKLWL